MKNPIPYTYDLNTKSAQKVICVTHTDDNSVDVIQLHVVQNGALIDFSGNTIIARMVMSRTHELLSDNVVCTIDEVTKDIMIPIDRKAVSTRKGLMLVEVSVRGVLPQKLTFQFPLLVRVNGSILDDAEITPESQGTIPELLIAAAEELRRVQGFITSDDVYDILDSTLQGAQNVAPSLYVKRKGDNYALVYEDSEDVLHELFDFANLPSGTSDYTDLENKPQINSHTLSGNQTGSALGLQDKLIAGQNITISGNEISASGGVTSYNDLDNKPKINGVTVDGNMLAEALYLQESLRANDGTIEITEIQIGGHIKQIRAGYKTIKSYDFDSYSWTITPSEALRRTPLNTTVYVDRQFASAFPKTDDYFVFSGRFYYPPGNKTNISQIAINKSGEVFFRFGSVGNNGNYYNEWQTLNKEIVSGVVNQNGTITFTDSDGNTFTTTGVSVIGADGFSPTATVTQTASGATVSITDSTGTTTANISNGADGQDYVLTAQDKSDIADIVLSELPTTQGVLYGNTSN